MAVRVRELEKIRLRKGVLIQGLPGIGLVGKIAVDYIVRELKPRRVAELYADTLYLYGGNVGVIVDEKGVLELPRYYFYLYAQEDRDVVFVTSPVQPVSWGQYEVANHVLDYFQMNGGVEVVSVCGTTMGEEPGVYFAVARGTSPEELLRRGYKASPGGVITGACGLLPALAALRGMKAYVLMGYTSRLEPDPEAAKAIVSALCDIYGFKISLEDLDKMIEEIKKREAEQLKTMKEAKERGQPPFYV